MTWLIYILTIAAGTANPFQSGTNAQLNKQLGAPLWAGITVYFTGLAGLFLLQVFLRQAFPATSKILGVNEWAWFGGLISIFPTMAGLVFAQRLGSGVFTGITLTASLITSVLLDQFGIVGFTQHTASPSRIAGCGLMIAGLWMISRS